MTDYVKSTNFASKDSLATGNPLKIVKGTEIDTEFNNIATAVATKADILSPTFTGTPAAPTATAGTNTTQLATTAFVSSAITAYDTALTVSTTQIEDNAVTNAKMADLSVGTAELIDDSVTAAKIAASAVGTSEIADASVTTVKVADSSITPAKLSQPLTRGTSQPSTSGTSLTFTGIPIWAKRVTIMFSGVSMNGVNRMTLRLGTSGGVDSAATYEYNVVEGGGYIYASAATEFQLNYTSSAAFQWNGVIQLLNISGNTWVLSGNYGPNSSGAQCNSASGKKPLSGALDRLQFSTVGGTDAFDAGTINIMYE